MPNNLNLTKTREAAEKFVKNATKYTAKLKKIPKLFLRANIKKQLAELKKVRSERAKIAKRDNSLMAKEHKISQRLDEKRDINFDRWDGYLSKEEMGELF